MHMQRVLVTGAGGFIGHHLVKRLVVEGCWVRGVDLKAPEYEPSPAHEFELLDLRRWDNCTRATRGVEEVYNLAANMGGIGFIESHKAEIMHDNVLINVHMLEAARLNGVKRYLYTSSACVYPAYRQNSADVTPLKEEDAYPADPEDGYGWEKLCSDRQCRHYYEDYGLETRVVRFHNIYGPLGTYDGGREKSPAAICRKVALVEDGGGIEKRPIRGLKVRGVRPTGKARRVRGALDDHLRRLLRCDGTGRAIACGIECFVRDISRDRFFDLIVDLFLGGRAGQRVLGALRLFLVSHSHDSPSSPAAWVT